MSHLVLIWVGPRICITHSASPQLVGPTPHMVSSLARSCATWRHQLQHGRGVMGPIQPMAQSHTTHPTHWAKWVWHACAAPWIKLYSSQAYLLFFLQKPAACLWITLRAWVWFMSSDMSLKIYISQGHWNPLLKVSVKKDIMKVRTYVALVNVYCYSDVVLSSIITSVWIWALSKKTHLYVGIL